jgi:hypothetical protein
LKRSCHFILLFLIFVCQAYASTEYVVASSNDFLQNTLAVYQLDTASGALTKVASLSTGGTGLGPNHSNNVSFLEQAISPNANCIFAVDAGSNDIAAFSKGTSYSLVGNYSNSSLNASFLGGSLAIAPNGKFLYASYSTTENIGAWQVNQDCSLSLIGVYAPSAGAADNTYLKVTPNGKQLVASVGVSAELFSIDQNTGALLDVGYLSFQTVSSIWGLDITRDSRVVVLAGITTLDRVEPVALAAQITSTGLIRPRAWSLLNATVNGNEGVFLGAGGYAGNGNLYFGMNDGVVTTLFTEQPLKVTIENATSTLPLDSDAAIGVTGNILVMAQVPNALATFSINQDGSLTPLSSTVLDDPNAALFSLSVFPNTR